MTGNDEREKHDVKQRLAKEFEINELGKLKYFLGIEVAYSTQGIFISQQKYVTNLLAETRKIGCKLVSTTMDPNHKLGEAKKESMMDKIMYQRLVATMIQSRGIGHQLGQSRDVSVAYRPIRKIR